jgi:molecular chaperone Hsp33
MNDLVYRGILREADVRFTYAVCTRLADEAVRRHNCDPLASHVLCRALGAGVLTIPLLNADERYSLRWNYAGAVKSVVVEARGNGTVRGFINPANLADYVTEEEQIHGASGTVTVIRADQEQILNSGTGQAGLLDVVEDLAFFFSTSDQVETAMVVMVGFAPDPKHPVKLCQGFMIQALPGCDLERFERLRQRLGSPACRKLIAEQPRIDNHFERLVQALAGDEVDPVFSLDAGPVPLFRCTCSAERMRELLATLGRADLEAAADSGETLKLTCHFCSSHYEIPPEQVRQALAELDS